jgi:UDP-N-acetylmuramoyl-tripeptide--D-alanyl-D-alanine ligase
MTKIFKASEAAEFCGGKLFGPDIQICRQWRSDSRDVAPGDAFVAINGAKTDGHLFILQAIERGAKLLFIDLDKMEQLGLDSPEYSGVTIIAVPDTLKGLARLATAYFKTVSPQLIGITGSVGKTTTRELIVSALKKKYKVHSAIRSFNTIIGCSLTILAMPSNTEMLVLEFGTNHFGEIAEMTSLFPPDAAMITEVAPAHLEGFGSISGVLKAKLEICGQNGLEVLVYNADNMLLRDALLAEKKNIRLIGVGYNSEADLKICGAEISLDDNGAKVSAEYMFDGKRYNETALLFGRQHAYNIGFALAIAKYFKVSDEDVKAAFEELKPINGRGVCKKLYNGAWVIDEAYNANPSSMRAAIENVVSVAAPGSRKKIAVLGGMRELGEDSAYWHKEMLLLTKDFDKVLLFGEEWLAVKKELTENSSLYASFEELAEAVLKLDTDNSIILIKGSNSYGLKKLVALLTEGTDVR